MQDSVRTFTAFAGTRRIGAGTIEELVRQIKACVDAGEQERVAVFDDETGRTTDLDLRGTADEAVARLAEHPLFGGPSSRPAHSGPGRPKLGVVSREVSLLPRHWDWLGEQQGGASAALRRLVDEARAKNPAQDARRRARNAAHAFLWEMAGNLPAFEEATRALDAQDWEKLGEITRAWPQDIHGYLATFLERMLPAEEGKGDGPSKGAKP